MDNPKKMKNPSLFKNLIVMVVSILIIGSFAVLVNATWTMMLYGGTYVVAVVALVLALRDAVDKIVDKEKLNLQYFLGMGAVILAIGSFIWASVTVEGQEKDMWLRLALAVFFSGLGGWIYAKPYKNALMEPEKLQQANWEKIREIIAKGKLKRERAEKIINKTLRYCLVGDNLNGDLDFSRPLAFFNKSCMTVKEVEAIGENSHEAVKAKRYTDQLLEQLDLKTEPEGGDK